jgi:hypothetical protein
VCRWRVGVGGHRLLPGGDPAPGGVPGQVVVLGRHGEGALGLQKVLHVGDHQQHADRTTCVVARGNTRTCRVPCRPLVPHRDYFHRKRVIVQSHDELEGKAAFTRTVRARTRWPDPRCRLPASPPRPDRVPTPNGATRWRFPCSRRRTRCLTPWKRSCTPTTPLAAGVPFATAGRGFSTSPSVARCR